MLLLDVQAQLITLMPDSYTFKLGKSENGSLELIVLHEGELARPN
jgi:hypothetical protein